MQIVVAPDEIEIITTEKGVIVVKIREMTELEIFFGSDDNRMIERIQNAIYEQRAKDLGLE